MHLSMHILSRIAHIYRRTWKAMLTGHQHARDCCKESRQSACFECAQNSDPGRIASACGQWRTSCTSMELHWQSFCTQCKTRGRRSRAWRGTFDVHPVAGEARNQRHVHTTVKLSMLCTPTTVGKQQVSE